MKLISDVINELNELREMHGNIECVGVGNEEVALEYNNDDDDEVIVFE